MDPKYALGVFLNIAIALWLLSVARGEYAWLAWIAYFQLTLAALMILAGICGYWLWFAERGLSLWYSAALSFVVGAGLLAGGTRLNWDGMAISGAMLLTPLPAYCAWRLAKLAIVRLFGVLLLGIQQAGQAWRGETPKGRV